ncbi:MAG: hypothetical protein II899_12900 [Bacteroidales bacterium]|nr:hypothetical protein [Bacteroidales bacterium]
MEKIMKDNLCFLLTIVVFSFFSLLNAQSNYTLAFKHIDKQTSWLPINLHNQTYQGSTSLSTMKRLYENDEMLSLIRSKIDSCVVHNDTLLVYFNPTNLTVFLDTISSLFYFELSGTTNLKRNFSLTLPTCSNTPPNINILIIESFITQHTFVKSGDNRYKYAGSRDIYIDIDYIRKHDFRIEYATIRS